MPNTVVARYYPTLDTVINTDEIPEVLGFLKTAIESLLSSLHYKDLQYSKSVYGDKAFYSLKIVSKNRIELEIPGTGIFLVLNPNVDTEISAFPITIQYEWPILAYLRSFNLDGFAFSPEDFFHLALQVLKISEAQVLANAINIFADSQNPTTSAIQQFIDNVNAQYAIDIADPENTDNPIPELTASLKQALGSDISMGVVVFTTYMGNLSDLDELKAKVNLFFKSLLPTDDVETYLKDLIIPKFSTSLLLSAGIEFPRSMLQPVYPEGHQLQYNIIPALNDETDEPRAGFMFAEALFYASTEEGFGYQMDIVLTSTSPVMIGNTGIILFIDRLKVDLSDTENIPEADLDGRPPSFKGVYADEVSVVLPPRWFDSEENHPGTTAKLGGYNMLIGNGGISGTIVLEAIEIQEGAITDYYEDCFSFQYPIDVISGGNTTTINTYGDLLTYINANPDFEFDFPLSVQDTSTNNIIPFNNSGDFGLYLAQCDSTSPIRIVKRLGDNGFEIWFTSFDMTFQQGHIVESNIRGGLKIPRLKDANGDIANIDIYGHLDDDGGFNVTASEQDGFAPISLPNVLDLYINSLEIGRESSDEPFYIGTACDILFTNDIIKSFIGDQRINVERLRIYSDGSFEIVGGAIAVPTNFSMVLIGTKDNPVLEVSISGINYGSFQEEHNGVMRKYNYFGFDGAVAVGLQGFDARGGAGIKYFFTVDDGDFHSYIKIETLQIDLTIPGNVSPDQARVIIKGWLSVNEIEYAGGVSLKLNLAKLKATGSADMRLQPKYPAFLVDASLELPIAIPIAATGLGITGFRGLLGFRYVAEKEAVGLHSHDDKWYDYYTYPPRGVHESKFNGPDKTEDYTDPMSIGAGVTISTMGSSDAISLRVMVLLSIPNMIMIDGRASVLSKEWGLDDSGEPPFFAFMVLAENGIEIGAGVDFKLPQNNGQIIDLHAYMEAGYFWDNPSGWYLNMGTRQDPISAKVLTLIQMQSFLMLSASGIEAGAKVSFDISERFGPIKVKAWFIAEVGGFISFERPQIGGYMTVDAGARVDLFGIITVGVSFFVHFSAEAAKPFLIYAEIRVCGRIKIGFIKIRICARVKMKWEKSREVDRTPIPPIALSQEQREQAVKGIHMLTGETFDLISFSSPPNANSPEFDNAIIPLDTYVDIKFDKSVLQHDQVSGIIGSYNNPPENYEDLIPPVKVIKGNELRQVKHRYQITNIKIKAAKEGSTTWVDYHPYEAVVNSNDRDSVDHLRIGHWQKSNKEYNAIRLLATSPFSYVEQGEPGWFIPEQLGLTHATFFCEGEARRSKCANWLNTTIDTQYNTVNHFPYYRSHQDLFFNVFPGVGSLVDGIEIGSSAKVVSQPNAFNFDRSLEIHNTSTLDFKLPQPAAKVDLKLSTNAQSVKVEYYKSVLEEGAYQVHYELIETVVYTSSQLSNQSGISYENNVSPISKFKIIPQSSIQSEIDAIYEQIEQLFVDTYAQLGNDIPEGVSVEIPLDSQTYFSLLNNLETLQNQSCSPSQECIKDERICGPFESLSILFKNYFPESIESIEEIHEFISFYNEFLAIIDTGFDVQFIELNLQPLYNEYRSLLEEISENLNDNEYIPRYYEMRDKADQIISKLNTLGNCDCSQTSLGCNNKDEVLCDFYQDLDTIYTSCIQPVQTIEDVQDSLTCINNFINAIKNFDRNYEHELTSYDIEEYLAQNYDYLYNAWGELSDYFSGQSSLSEEQAIDLYNSVAVVYTEVIVSLVSQLGNCNCEDQEEPQLSCSTLIHEVCWLSVVDWTYNQNIPGQEAIQEDYQATVDAINNVVDPIWRPNTKYFVEFTARDIVDDDENTPNNEYNYYYGFKTVGTIGHYHNAPNVDYGNEYQNDPNTGEIVLVNRDGNGKLTNPSKYALTSLEQYIDYRRSYPNADGNLLQSKPLFYNSENAKLSLFYVKPYVAHMLKDKWDAYGMIDPDNVSDPDNFLPEISNNQELQALKVFIQDPVSDLIMEHPMPPLEEGVVIPETQESWSEDTQPPMPIMLQIFQDFVEVHGGDCNFQPGELIKPASEFTTISIQNLKPRKMYTAIFTNTFKDVTERVHNYVFQTSRYSNFMEQVESYILERDENDTPITAAVFNLDLDLNTQMINKAYDIVYHQASTNDLQESQYIDFLDRILEGIFRMTPLDPPITTEFNTIKNLNNDEIVALLIRNPEPFNDPKTPLEVIKGIEGSQIEEEQGTVAIMQSINERYTEYSMLYSKDYSQILVMHSSKKILANSLDLRFQYRLWDGNSYIIKDSVFVDDLVLNLEN